MFILAAITSILPAWHSKNRLAAAVIFQLLVCRCWEIHTVPEEGWSFLTRSLGAPGGSRLRLLLLLLAQVARETFLHWFAMQRAWSKQPPGPRRHNRVLQSRAHQCSEAWWRCGVTLTASLGVKLVR